MESGTHLPALSVSSFYSCGCDSQVLFEGHEVSRHEDWDRHLNAYNVLQLYMAEIVRSSGGLDVSAELARMVLPELRAPACATPGIPAS